MATQNELFKVNISQVLRSIWLKSGISRVELSKNLQMDKSTVTKIVTYLLELGIIKTEVDGNIKSQGGRRPIPLSININYGCVLGIEIQTDYYSAVLLDLNGNLLHSKNKVITFGNKNLTEIFFNIVNEMKALTDINSILGIVVGVSGIINSSTGVIIKSNPLNIFEELNFCKEAQDKLGIPVLIENDSNCCCWGELVSLKLENPNNMLFILGEFREVETKHTYYSGIGFGFGILIDGSVYYGHEFSAGEFKSILCKSTGVSQFSLPDDTIENIQNKPNELITLFEELAMNVSLVVNFFNISEIVLGGAIEKYNKSLEEILSNEIQKNWSYPNQMTYNIRTSNHIENTVAIGAGCMFLERLFGIPMINSFADKHDVRGVELLNIIKLKESK